MKKMSLEENARKVLSRYYHKSKVNAKVRELLANRKMANNQGGGKINGSQIVCNKYFEFFIDENDVYHRTIWSTKWSNKELFNKNAKVKVNWRKN